MTEGIDKLCQREIEGHAAFFSASMRVYKRKKKESQECAD